MNTILWGHGPHGRCFIASALANRRSVAPAESIRNARVLLTLARLLDNHLRGSDPVKGSGREAISCTSLNVTEGELCDARCGRAPVEVRRAGRSSSPTRVLR